MKVRMAKSCAGPWGSAKRGEVLHVGAEIPKNRALEFLNAGLAVAVADAGAETAEFPVHTGAGWYKLSNGEKVRGQAEAEKAEKAL